MVNNTNKQPEWVTKGKTIRQLIQELQTFEDQDLEVQISLYGGESHKPISIVGRYGDYCLLVNCENQDDIFYSNQLKSIVFN